jgi:hypothetical protein
MRVNAKKEPSRKNSAADIKEVKTSLKSHFDAIQSLQNALSSTAAAPIVMPSRLVGGNKTNEQSSLAIKDRIRMIESTLRDVGENISISENISDPSSHYRPPTPSNNSHSQYEGIRSNKTGPNPINKPALRPNSKYAAPHPSVIDRLEKMEISLSKLATTLAETQVKTKSREKQNPEDFGEPSSIEKLMSEVHKLRHDFKAQGVINQEILRKNDDLEKQIRLMADPASMVLKSGQVDPRVENYCKKLIANLKTDLIFSMQSKVDTAVLEELAQHIATKEELKNYLKKEKLGKILGQYQTRQMAGTMNGTSILDVNQQEYFAKYESRTQETITSLFKALQELDSKISASNDANQEFVEKSLGNLKQNFELRISNLILEKSLASKSEYDDVLQSKIEKLKSEIDRGVKEMISTSMQHIFDENTYFPNNEEETNPLLKKLVRDFDEKIYTICSDLSSCKQLFVSQSSQPFYRCAQWVWTSGQLKLGSAIPWNLQTSNTGKKIF